MGREEVVVDVRGGRREEGKVEEREGQQTSVMIERDGPMSEMGLGFRVYGLWECSD